MYRIRGTDQKEYGPVGAEVVRQWITERRAHGKTPIQVAGSAEWITLAEIPEFADALAAAAALPPPGIPPAVIRPALPPSQRKGLAIASLVLGIVSLTCLLGPLAGIPAIVLGHIAFHRARREPVQYGGSGLALVGFILGYGSVVLTLVLTAFLLPVLKSARSQDQLHANSSVCISNMKQIALGARMYAINNEDVFPPDFESMSNELVTPKVLWCRGDTKRTEAEKWSALGPRNISYEYLLPGLPDDQTNRNKVVFRCPIHGHEALANGTIRRKSTVRKSRF